MRGILLISIFFLICTPVYAEKAMIGTTFSQVQCVYFNMDWREVYEKTLRMNFDIIRLGAYWNRIERMKDEYDFSELDWQIQKAKEKGVKIILTVGMKAPRWPEYFIPEWVMERVGSTYGKDVSLNSYLRIHVLDFIKTVVNRYSKEQIIVAWQVENEPFNRAGPKDWWINRNFLKQEIALVRANDPNNRPIIVNALAIVNRLLRFLSKFIYSKNPLFETIEVADIPAINFYPVIGHKIGSTKICFLSDKQANKQYLKGLIDTASKKNKKMWLTELQAEPWEPGELVHFSKETSLTCSAELFESTFTDIKTLNIDAIFLWGVEYWHFRNAKHGDDSWLRSAESILEENRSKKN